MHRRHVAVALVAVNLVLAVTAALLLLGRRSREHPAPLLDETTRVEVVRISGARGSRVINMEKESPVMLAATGEVPVRQDRIELLLQALRRAQVVRVVTEDTNDWAHFGVEDSPTPNEVALQSGPTLVIGDRDTAQTYLRKAGSPTVYAVDTDLRFFTDQPDEFWMPLRLFPSTLHVRDVIFAGFEPAAAEDGSLAFSLLRSGDGWRAGEEGRRVDLSSADQSVGAVVDLLADTLVPRAAWTSGRPAGTLVIRTADAREWRVPVLLEGGRALLDAPGSDPPRTGGVEHVISVERLVAVLASASSL